MQYISRMNGASAGAFLIDYRDAQVKADYNRVGKLLTIKNVNKYDRKLDIRREIAFHRETGNSISRDLAIELLCDLERYSVLYDATYVKNMLYTISKKIHVDELSIEVKPYVYLEIYFTFESIVKYLYVNPNLIERDMACMVLGDGLKQLEAQEAFDKLSKKMEER